MRPVVITHRPARPDGPLGRVPALAPPPVITVHHRPAVAVGVQDILGRGPVLVQPQSQSQAQVQVQPRVASFQLQGAQQAQVQALVAQQRQQRRQQELEQQQSKVQVHVQENGLPIRLTVQQLLQRIAGNQQQQQQTQRTEPARGAEPQQAEVQLSPGGLHVRNGVLGRAQGAERPGAAAAVTVARSQPPPSPHRAESGGSPRSDSTFAPSVGPGANRGAAGSHERGLSASLGRQGQEVESDQQARASATADAKVNPAPRSMLADAAAAAGGGSGIAAALKLLVENGLLPARLAQAAAEAAPVKGTGGDAHANGHGSSPVAAALRRGAQEVHLQQVKRGSWDGDGYTRQQQQQQQRPAFLGHGREEQQLAAAERQVYKQQQQDVRSSRDVAMQEAREQARGAPVHVYRNTVADTVVRAEGAGGLHASPLRGHAGFGLVAGKRLSGGDGGEEAAEQRKRARYAAAEDAMQLQQQQLVAGRRLSEAEGYNGQLQEALQRQQQQQQGVQVRPLQSAPSAQAHAQQEMGRPGLSPVLATLLQQNKQRQQQQQEALQQQQQQQQQRNPASANGSRPMGTSLLDTIAALQHQQQRQQQQQQQLQQPGVQRHGRGGLQGQESGIAAQQQQQPQQRVMVRGQPLYSQAPKAEQYDMAYDNAQDDARRNGGMAGGLLLRDLEQRALLVQQQQQQHQQQPVDYVTQAQLRHGVVDAAAAAPRGVMVSRAPASGQYGNGQQYQVVQVRGGGAVGNGRGMQQGGYYSEDGALGGQVQIAGRKGPHVRVEGGNGGSVKAVVQGGNGGLVMLPVLDLGKPSATMAF